MNMARSTYYYRPKGRKPNEPGLLKRIEELAVEFVRYGHRRIVKQLKRDGFKIGKKKVLRIMREKRLLVKPVRRFVRTTDSKHGLRVYPNLIRGLVVKTINQVWVSDITYIRILRGFVYLAVIMDLFSRKAIGHAISKSLSTPLSLGALSMAIQNRRPAAGVIHHSDRGVQYADHRYINELRSHKFVISMSRKGNPYDNASAESLIKTLKSEEVHLWEYRDIADVKKRLPYFIEEMYNQKRLHSSLGYLPPNEFEEMISKEQNQDNPCLAMLT